MSTTPEQDEDRYALDMEWQLTFAVRRHCAPCVEYLATSRERIIPAVMRKAFETGADPLDLLSGFLGAVHDRHDDALDAEAAR